MAWVQVGTKTTTNTWGSAPPITCKWVFTAFRDDVTNELLLRTVLSATYVSGYFGYNIQVSCFVVDSSTMQGSYIKNNLPNTWGTVSGTYEWNLGVYEGTSVLGAAAFASNSGRAQLDLRLTVETPLIVQEEEEEITDAFGENIIGDYIQGIQLQKDYQNVYPVPYFPIGAIYMSTESISPANLIGGTWTQLEDRFLLAAGDSYSLGATGGEATVTLTTDTMPAHTHPITAYYGGRSITVQFHSMGDGSTTVNTTTASTGSGTAHNNMPPYLVVYMWRRTE